MPGARSGRQVGHGVDAHERAVVGIRLQLRHVQRLADPDFAVQYPYWQWVHSGLATDPRPQHLAWNGMVLHHSDPFWRSYYPPRIPPDWGCTCRVKAVSRPPKGAVTEPPKGWDKDKNPGAGAPPPFVADAIRMMVEEKLARLPEVEAAALRDAVAAYQAARLVKVVAPPGTVSQFAASTESARGRKLIMHVGPLRSVDAIRRATATEDGPSLDLEGYVISLDNSGVQHAFKTHGNPKTEASRGQMAIATSDFGVLEQVVNSPDVIKPDGQNISGRDVLLFTKLIDGIGYLIAMEVLTGKRLLMLNSVRKKRGAWRMQEEIGQ